MIRKPKHIILKKDDEELVIENDTSGIEIRVIKNAAMFTVKFAGTHIEGFTTIAESEPDNLYEEGKEVYFIPHPEMKWKID
jgi:hypothetical protein